MSHSMLNDPLSAEWPTQCCMTHSVLNDPLGAEWPTQCWMSHSMLNDPLSAEWPTQCWMTHSVLNDPLTAEWAIQCYLAVLSTRKKCWPASCYQRSQSGLCCTHLHPSVSAPLSSFHSAYHHVALTSTPLCHIQMHMGARVLSGGLHADSSLKWKYLAVFHCILRVTTFSTHNSSFVFT